MSTNNERLSAVLSTQDAQDIETALDLLEDKFSFLRTLTPDEKLHKVRLGVNNLAFVQTAKEAYDEMPELLPLLFSNSDYEKDLAMLMAIRPYQSRLNQLTYLMEDTAILLGDHTYKDSLVIFRSAQEAMKRGIDGGRLWVEKLEPRFEGQGVRRVDEEDEEMDGQADGISENGSGNSTNGSGGSQGGSDNPANGSGGQGSSSDAPDNDPASTSGQTQGNDSPSNDGGNVNSPDAA